jgi:excisionase family DNA binding protein
VLAIGEAATRLGMSRAQLEKMVDTGTVQALPVGFTRMIPTREVERLQASPGE